MYNNIAVVNILINLIIIKLDYNYIEIGLTLPRYYLTIPRYYLTLPRYYLTLPRYYLTIPRY